MGDPLLQTLGLALQTLVELEIAYALVGGMAATFRGRIRSTRDCDMLVFLEDEKVQALKDALREQGFSHLDRADRHRLEDVMLFRFWFPVGDSGFSLSLDLQSGRSPFHQEVLRRAELLDVLGLHVKVATREDLVLLKLAAWRPIDRADAIDLLQFTNGCDDKYLDHWAALLGLEDRLSEARSS